MDGSRRRLAVVMVALIVAACESKPVVTTPLGTTPSPPATATGTLATPHATPAIIPGPSAPPTSVQLPAGFDDIAWAHMPVAADTESFVVTFGVLGKPATGTRSYTGQPRVSASGASVVIETYDEAKTEIIDARTGVTLATFSREAIRLSLDGIDPNDLRYTYFGKFVADVEHGYLYDMSASRSGMQLRRFDLHGEHPVLLATLAPDPGKDFWVEVDFVVADDGTVVATSCAPDESKVTDHRCRLWTVPVGATGPITPRRLPANSPRPCFLLAADSQFLIGSQYAGCRADGGADQFIPYMALDLKTLGSMVTEAPSDIEGDGIEYQGNDVGPLPALVANLHPRIPYGSPYPQVAVLLQFGDGRFTVESYVQSVENP